jgi:hypothetical protein
MPVTEQTRYNAGTVTAPGVGATVASIAAPPDGLYDVAVKILLTGTAETALKNLRLRENGNTIADLPTLSSAGDWTEVCLKNVEVNQGGGNLDVIAIAAATAGAIYNVAIEATRKG